MNYDRFQCLKRIQLTVKQFLFLHGCVIMEAVEQIEISAKVTLTQATAILYDASS
jgi:hypothetical protein